MQKKKIIGIDIGATYIKAGLVENSTTVSKFIEISTPKTQFRFERIFSQLIGTLSAKDTIGAIGIGVPGLFDYNSDEVIFCPNSELDFDKINSKYPIYIGNDVDLALLGELELRPKDKGKPLALVAIGSGLGGAFTLAGKSPTEFNLAGEIGHMKVAPNGKKCSCGEKGCLEAYVSGWAILRQAKLDISEEIENVITVFELAEAGNPKAQKIIYETAEMLGIGIANLVNILGVEKIILAGQISKSAPILLKYMHESDQKNIFAFKKRKFSVEISKNIDHIGVLGAAKFAGMKLER